MRQMVASYSSFGLSPPQVFASLWILWLVLVTHISQCIIFSSARHGRDWKDDVTNCLSYGINWSQEGPFIIQTPPIILCCSQSSIATCQFFPPILDCFEKKKKKNELVRHLAIGLFSSPELRASNIEPSPSIKGDTQQIFIAKVSD